MVKKNLPWMVLFLILSGLSVWAITSQSRDFSLAYLMAELRNLKLPWTIAAVISMTGFILFEGMAVALLARGLAGHKNNHFGIVYGAADVYFSAITPSATGGQPASAVFMIWDGIPGAKTAVILLVNLIMYTFALLSCGVLVFLTRAYLFFGYGLPAQILIAGGSVVMAGLGIGFMLLLMRADLFRSIGILLIRLGEKLHIIRHPQTAREKLEHKVEQYRECARETQGKKKLLLQVFGLNLLQRLSQSLVTPLMYMALGGSLRYAYNAWSVQILANLGSNMIPIPGAMGVADYLLLDGLAELGDIHLVTSVTNLELICRGLSFYVCVILSLVILILGYIRRRIKERNR